MGAEHWGKILVSLSPSFNFRLRFHIAQFENRLNKRKHKKTNNIRKLRNCFYCFASDIIFEFESIDEVGLPTRHFSGRRERMRPDGQVQVAPSAELIVRRSK